MKETLRFLRGNIGTLVLFPQLVFAQGGPPFRSDDPDTPGNRHWEINMGFAGDRNPVAGAYAVPEIDINFGLGHRIQLKFEAPLSIQETRDDSSHVSAGLGNSLLGVKYRFYAHHPKEQTRDAAGERESSFSLSIYPQLLLNNRTRSGARGITEPGPQFLLPLEANVKLGPIRASGEIGYWFTPSDVPRSWICGIVVGHEFRKDAGLYLELYDQEDVADVNGNPKARESTVGVGARLPVSRNGAFRVIGMSGRSLVTATPTNGQPSWIAYVGIQFLSAKHRRRSSDFMEPAK
jgi:hypothetical protein